MTGIYSLSIFTSAFLLFLIQPMISKLLLPHLGGSPAVWNTAMMVFQMLLLLGYLYAHATAKWLKAKKQAILHLILLLVAITCLPITLKTELGFESIHSPIRWVIESLLFSIGFPFFMLSATAPILQFWLASSTHKDAQNPYFLYSASNIGSLLALFSYPFIIEPLFTLPGQTGLWSGLFIVLVVLLAACAYYLKTRARSVAAIAETQSHDVAPTLKNRIHWVLLAFFPSSLLLGVTTFITTDIASIPLFWVIPLAIYLLTFIFAFARTPLMVDRALNAQMILVPITTFALVFKFNFITQVLIIHLFTFFAIAMGCHGTLARNKPGVKYLTEYFVWVSFGGMLGGVFNSLVAPMIFTQPVEYPLILLLSLLMRPVMKPSADPTRALRMDLLFGFGFAALLWLLFTGFNFITENYKAMKTENYFFALLTPISAALLYDVMMVAIVLNYKRPVRFTLIVLSLVIVVPITAGGSGSASGNPQGSMLYVERNFFGVNRIFYWPPQDAHLLMHGTTTHGLQQVKGTDKLHLSSYYGALSDLFDAAPAATRDAPIGAIGLGAGTVACLGHKDQEFDFYEIDPAVSNIARNPDYFTYLRDCGPNIHITLGDGRLSIAHAPDHRYGILIMDAFSSDAIPVHLLTREAFRLYLSKLTGHGIIAINISNRHLDLVPVMAALGQDAHLSVRMKRTTVVPNKLEFPSVWIAMARDDADFGTLPQKGKWKSLTGANSSYVWTDNYSNILQTLF